MFDQFYVSGFEIIESDTMVEQYRFPKSKKKRIRKKWRNRPENWRPCKKMALLGNKILVHPIYAKALKEKFSKT